MAKDPAFLFYPNDWIGGTMGMTFEEKGAYMELLMMQFNRGHMEAHMIGQVVGQLWDKIQDKFIQDEKGLWYNVRLQEEQIKRKAFTDSRKNNLTGKNQHTKKVGHTTSLMENENEDIDSLNNKGIKKEILNSKNWIEQICIKKNIEVNQCEIFLNKFLDDAELKDEINDLSDTKRHFVNWLNIELKKEPKKNGYVI